VHGHNIKEKVTWKAQYNEMRKSEKFLSRSRLCLMRHWCSISVQLV